MFFHRRPLVITLGNWLTFSTTLYEGDEPGIYLMISKWKVIEHVWRRNRS